MIFISYQNNEIKKNFLWILRKFLSNEIDELANVLVFMTLYN